MGICVWLSCWKYLSATLVKMHTFPSSIQVTVLMNPCVPPSSIQSDLKPEDLEHLKVRGDGAIWLMQREAAPGCNPESMNKEDELRGCRVDQPVRVLCYCIDLSICMYKRTHARTGLGNPN